MIDCISDADFYNLQNHQHICGLISLTFTLQDL